MCVLTSSPIDSDTHSSLRTDLNQLTTFETASGVDNLGVPALLLP